MTPKPHAYFLVAHGSRRSQLQHSLHQLADYFHMVISDALPHHRTDGASPWVQTGCLEFQAATLSEQLVQFYQSLPPAIEQVHVLPIFLLPGNHVREDIPAALQQAQKAVQALKLDRSVSENLFVLCPHLGSHPDLKDIIQSKMATHQPDAWILLGHGSRRPEGNLAIEQIATHLHAQPAFWAVQPSLSEQIKMLVSEGIRSIGVMPYFLFPGKITDAIAAQAEQLSHQYPDVTLKVLSPLSATPQLANALLDLSQSPTLTNDQIRRTTHVFQSP